MESIQRFCGLPYNGSYVVWDNDYETFGECFLWTAVSYTSHAILAIVSAYCFGNSRKFSTRNKPFIVLLMNALTLILALTCLAELIIAYALQHEHPPAYVLAKALAFSTWLLCFCIHVQTNAMTSQKKRNNRYIIVAFLFILVSSSLQLHYVIRHMLVNHLSIRDIHAGFIGVIVYFSLNVVFLLSCTVVCVSKTKRTSFNRSIPSLSTSTSAIVNNIEESGEHGSDSSLVSSEVNRVGYYDVYTKRKQNRTDIYLGKAEGSSNLLSRLLFWWSNPLILKGYHCQLEKPDDLFILPNSLDTNLIKEILSSMLRIQRHRSLLQELKTEFINEYQGRTKSRPVRISMLKSLHKAFGRFYYSLGILKFIYDCVGFAGPILLNYLVSFMENKKEPMKNGYLYALGLFLSTICSVVISLQYSYYIQKVGLQVRAGLITTVYEKTLSVSSSSLNTFSTGQVVNFMSTDTDRVVNFCNSFHEFWSMPFQVAVCLYLLYQQVGLAFLTGLGFIILLIPVNRWLAIKIGVLSKDMMQQKDSRVKLMNEILFGIRIIKMYAWEDNFEEKVNNIRKMELKSLKKRKYLDALCVYFWATTPVLISILTFMTYVLLGNRLTAAKVFTSIALFNMLIAPLNAFPWVLNGLMEAWVSLKRIEKYLCLPEINFDEYYIKMSADEADEMSFEVDGGCFRWQETDYTEIKQCPEDEKRYEIARPFELQNISFFIEKGFFIGVTGKVGSGKSSLFSAISSEMEKNGGHVYLTDSFEGFAYVTQDPWIQHMSIRDNILFGSPYDAIHYQEVLFACALSEDINILPAKDFTEVGENGVNLSGGQKARISLARAVYQNKDIYLLDDPIAAVDAHVAAHLFKHCIMGLLKNKTRLLCTHHKKYLEKADSVIYMQNGMIESKGPPKDILSKYDDGLVVEDNNSEDQVFLESQKEAMDDITLHTISLSGESGRLVEEEEREKGVVSLGVYKAYWKSAGSFLALSILSFLFFMQASRNISDWWLAYWISHSSIHDNKTAYYDPALNPALAEASSDVKEYLIIYGSIGVANTILTFFRAFLFAYGGIEAAKCLHKKLLNALLSAPISFFDVTPIGRIINRFSSDVYSVDDSLPFIMNIMLAQIFGVLGTIIVTCYGIPWFSIVLVPLGAVYYYTQHYYRRTSRELKRLSTVTLSPVYEHFSETLSGLVTIRAFQESHRFISENERKLDFNQRANYASLVASMWLSLRLSLIAVAMVTCVAFLAVFEHHFNNVNPGLVGLALSYALSITWKLSGLITSFTETEKQMVSVERVMQYVEKTPKEDRGTIQVDHDWPVSGDIRFLNVSLQYRKGLSLALENVSFKITGGEKIGICGRTGSGKSSLLRLLFKTIPLSIGEIIIDGLSIKNLEVRQIRSQMSIIPQDPFLFDDTLAANLDPQQRRTSFEMLEVLEKCHLKKFAQDLGGIHGKVGEKGSNLSAGQKQLLCLARALLKKSKIICIDEATASVDLETDQLIQATIREEFSTSTVLTIAHRVETIMDSDRVLVMGAGKVLEFAPPMDLLAIPDSAFYKLVHENNRKGSVG